LKFVLASSAKVVPAEVRKGVVRSVVRHAKKPDSSLHRFGMERTDKGLSISGSAPVNADLLDQALGKVARGIYYHHHYGLKKLVGDVEVHPMFLGIDNNAPREVHESFEKISDLITGNLRRFPAHGEHQDVFAYQVFDNPDLVTITMVFYQTKVAFVMKKLLDGPGD
jgi:hypothetical protein